MFSCLHLMWTLRLFLLWVFQPHKWQTSLISLSFLWVVRIWPWRPCLTAWAKSHWSHFQGLLVSCLYKICWLTRRKNWKKNLNLVFCYQNCSSDRDKLLKLEAEDQEFAKFLISLEQFIYTEKQFMVTECFFNLFLKVPHI